MQSPGNLLNNVYVGCAFQGKFSIYKIGSIFNGVESTGHITIVHCLAFPSFLCGFSAASAGNCQDSS